MHLDIGNNCFNVNDEGTKTLDALDLSAKLIFLTYYAQKAYY